MGFFNLFRRGRKGRLRNICIALSLFLSALFLAYGDPVIGKGNNKVSLCHLGPGSQEGGSTLVVDEREVADHMAHGDRIGVCEDAEGNRPRSQRTAAVDFIICDDRSGEKGRFVSVNPMGRVATTSLVCD